MDARHELGRAGEDLAARHLSRRGYRILERNFRCRSGELDIVARRGRTVVFCEVKTRVGDQWGEPSEAVGPRKQARLRVLAARWLDERKPGSVDIRFDVVAVVADPGAPRITHILDAF